VVRGTKSSVVWLDCPFNEKDDAKAEGAEWDPDAPNGTSRSGRWYAPPGVELEPLSRWIPRARTYLRNRYEDNPAVKALGAKFDPQPKRWYVPGGMDLRPFAHWIG